MKKPYIINEPQECYDVSYAITLLSYARNFYSCSWIVRSPTIPQPGLSRYSEASANVPTNRSTTRSASSVDIPCPVDRFDPKLDRQKGEDLRRPQAGYRVHSSVTSACEIEKSSNSAAMTFSGVTRHA